MLKLRQFKRLQLLAWCWIPVHWKVNLLHVYQAENFKCFAQLWKSQLLLLGLGRKIGNLRLQTKSRSGFHLHSFPLPSRTYKFNEAYFWTIYAAKRMACISRTRSWRNTVYLHNPILLLHLRNKSTCSFLMWPKSGPQSSGFDQISKQNLSSFLNCTTIFGSQKWPGKFIRTSFLMMWDSWYFLLPVWLDMPQQLLFSWYLGMVVGSKWKS